MEKKLQVRNLRISFRTSNGKVQAVRDISFDLAKGETLAIVGESGSGKSVTSKAILGIQAANAVTESGEIIYDGKDLLKISDEEVDMLGGEENVLQVMKDYGITVVVETLGSKGARCFFDGESFDIPGRKAVCVDATGAGDAFWGGFLSSLRIQGVEQAFQLTREKLEKAMTYGNVSGWICVQSKGAIESLPTRETIERYL